VQNGAHAAVVASLVQGFDDFIASGAAKCVHFVGTVDRDPSHAIAVFVNDVFKLHVFLQN
jgi:hypothetical protein